MIKKKMLSTFQNAKQTLNHSIQQKKNIINIVNCQHKNSKQKPLVTLFLTLISLQNKTKTKKNVQEKFHQNKTLLAN